MKINEVMIIRSGKLQYGVALLPNNAEKNDRPISYIYIESGKIYFADNCWGSSSQFNVGEDAHKIAKEIFMMQLQTDIKTKVMELKQLEEVLLNLGLKELIMDSVPNSARMLLEAKKEIINDFKTEIKETQSKIMGDYKAEIKEAQAEVISSIKPRAIKKKVGG